MRSATSPFLSNLPVCSCIPVRVSEVAGRREISVCMITSRGGKGLVFPKVTNEKVTGCLNASSCSCCLTCLQPMTVPEPKWQEINLILVTSTAHYLIYEGFSA